MKTRPIASNVTHALIIAMGVMVSITSAHATDGVVHDTGLNVNGQLGQGNAADQVNFATVYGLTDVVQVASGSAHTLALRTDGTVWAWGNNSEGQLGIGSTSFRSLVPLQVPGITNAVAVAAGHLHSLALLDDGSMKAWGENSNRQLGNGATSNSSSPVNVLASVANIVAIDAGLFHSIALRNDGRVYAWGKNTFGQLGLGASSGSGNPALIPDLFNVTAIAAGHYHNLALDTSGTVRAWGHNGRGQIGNGTITHVLAPVAVTSISAVTKIDAGGMHSLALIVQGSGSIMAWGKNANGQLGLGTTTDAMTPQLVTSLNSIVEVAAGSAHTIARDLNGVVSAWGFNNYGQLGDGTQVDSSLPIFINDALGATLLSCGDFQTFTIGRQPLCPGDIAPPPNGNGVVDVQDLLAVIGAWGACANPNDCPADIAPPGGNDVVNVEDLLAVIGAWGACP